MKYPSQIIYTPEELFTLKPNAFLGNEGIEPSAPAASSLVETTVNPMIPSMETALDQSANMAEIDSPAHPTIEATNTTVGENGFWKKYQWWVAGGLFIAGIGIYFYRRRKRKKRI